MTGAADTRIAWTIVESDTCARSTSIPRRFISRTTSRPNGESPPARTVSLFASAHACPLFHVSVM